MLVVVYRRFGTVCESPLQGQAVQKEFRKTDLCYYIREVADGDFFLGDLESVRLLEYAAATRAWGSGMADTRVRCKKLRN